VGGPTIKQIEGQNPSGGAVGGPLAFSPFGGDDQFFFA